MILKDWLSKWDLSSININANIVKLELSLNEADKEAAWELYTELVTRIATQPRLDPHHDNKSALTSLYDLFEITRGIMRKHGAKCAEFSKIAIPVLNQVLRPFTSRWHYIQLQGDLDESMNHDFLEELVVVQEKLRNYTKLLADMAGVEDLTQLEE